MLTYLRVRNFAIIDELEVELEAGMNVVTGETGAGKSILMSALSLVLGARARPEVVRTGAERAEVEALFDIADDPEALARVEEAGASLEDADGELVLRRVIQRSGRSRAYVNGKLASAAQLGELARGLCDISSQHEHHTLVDPHSHLLFLDAFAELQPLRDEVRKSYDALSRARAALADQSRDVQGRVEREDLLRFQIQEIDALDVQEGEEETLTAERDRQRHAERLAAITGGAEDALYASDGALCDRLGRIGAELEQAAALDATLAPLCEQLGSAQAQLEDVARELGSYARDVSLDSERLAELDERLDAIKNLERKYGRGTAAILEHRTRAAEELEGLDRSDERLAELQAEAERAEKDAGAAARKLSAARKKAARKLAKAVSAELSSLSMGDAEITVEVAQPEGGQEGLTVDGARLSPTGIDRVEFLIATNRGEKPQPLRRIASGGELSRAMLAVKRVLAGLGPGGLYVFDEVDSGVGGAVAEIIGRKIKEVAAHHQVICITHLPQIAVFADAHYYVEKDVAAGRTRSEIRRLDDGQQREEIARMLGGVKVTDKTRAAAKEMLRIADR
ncbi:MAG: DNA repair protein RecN [Myxococcales bacterium]